MVYLPVLAPSCFSSSLCSTYYRPMTCQSKQFNVFTLPEVSQKSRGHRYRGALEGQQRTYLAGDIDLNGLDANVLRTRHDVWLCERGGIWKIGIKKQKKLQTVGKDEKKKRRLKSRGYLEKRQSRRRRKGWVWFTFLVVQRDRILLGGVKTSRLWRRCTLSSSIRPKWRRRTTNAFIQFPVAFTQ